MSWPPLIHRTGWVCYNTFVLHASSVHTLGIAHIRLRLLLLDFPQPENVFLSGTSTGDVDWEGVLLGDFGSAVEVASGGRTTLSAKDTRYDALLQWQRAPFCCIGKENYRNIQKRI